MMATNEPAAWMWGTKNGRQGVQLERPSMDLCGLGKHRPLFAGAELEFHEPHAPSVVVTVKRLKAMKSVVERFDDWREIFCQREVFASANSPDDAKEWEKLMRARQILEDLGPGR